MPLKATKPKPNTEKRLKMFLFGAASTGKTRCALQFPKTYFFDCERGTDNYDDLFAKADSVRLQTTDIAEVIEQVKALATEKHEFRTVVIDPMTTLESDLLTTAEDQYTIGDMRIWRDRDRMLKRLTNLLYALDMNVILTAHGKIEYGDNMKRLGTTYDGWRRWIFVFDLTIELYRVGPKARGLVKKTRLASFPEGEEFDFSYEAMRDRFGKGVIERVTEPIVPASAENVAKLNQLISVVVLPAGTVERWKTKAGVDQFEDMTEDQIAKCLEYVRKKLETK